MTKMNLQRSRVVAVAVGLAATVIVGATAFATTTEVGLSLAGSSIAANRQPLGAATPTPATHGGSASSPANPKTADKATQVHMQFLNNTHETWTLTSESRSGDNAHWETQPDQTLQPGATGYASSYSSTNAQIDLTYTAAVTGAVIKLHGETPLVGSNQASGSVSSTSYLVSASADSGYNPTDTYQVGAGQNYAYTGQPTSYTVPPGVTSVNVDVVGGGGGDGTGDCSSQQPSGAEIIGTIDVTAGQVLTIGVGGMGGSDFVSNQKGGYQYNGVPYAGWGLTDSNDNNYGGGSGYGLTSGEYPGGNGGGGASVILNGSNDDAPLVIAGGGGGNSQTGDTRNCGGQGGYDNQLSGSNGGPNGQGGQAGANTDSRGQSSQAAGSPAGGAGGGGFRGGLAGSQITTAGGAGASFIDPSVSDTNIQVASGAGLLYPALPKIDIFEVN